MSLFDHIEQPPMGRPSVQSSVASLNQTHLLDHTAPSSGPVTDQFILDKVQFTFPSKIQCGQVSDNILVLGLESDLVLWIDLEKPNSILEIPCPSSQGGIEAIYLAPFHNALIISTALGENYFYYPNSKPRLLPKIKVFAKIS